jgi:transposase
MEDRKTSRQMTEQQRREAIQRHQSGESAASIGRAIGFSRQTIHNLISRYEKVGESCLDVQTRPGSGRTKLPGMTSADKNFLGNTLPNKSPHQMKIPGGSKDTGKWTGKEVRDLLLANTSQMVTLAECVSFIRELGLTPVPYHSGAHKDAAHANWRDWLSDDFISWQNEHCPKTLKHRESNAMRMARKRDSLKKRGAPALAERVWSPIKRKYLLNDPILEGPDTVAEHFANIAAKHSNKS